MKSLFYKSISQLITIAILFLSYQSEAQFVREYGTPLDESFLKIIRSGTEYYALGRGMLGGGATNRATVTRISALGVHQWTIALGISSEWTDAVETPSGGLMVVGYTLPLDATSKSIIGLVTKTGAFTWVKSFDAPGRDLYTRIVRNPLPQNVLFPYYVCGLQNDPAGNALWDDVVILNLNEAGTFNWKKKFVSVADDEFAKDLKSLSNGDLVLVGNSGSNGILLRINNSGALVNAGTPINLPIAFTDIVRNTANGFYAVGGTFPTFVPYLIKYDNSFNPLWHISISGLTAISQVWEDPATLRIYVTGTGVFNGKTRAVLIRLIPQTSTPTLEWVKFLDKNELSYIGGSYWFMSPNQIAFSDGRNPASGGLGGLSAFMSLSDMDLSTCITKTTKLDIKSQVFDYNGPDITSIAINVLNGVDILSVGLNWKDQEVCLVPCTASFVFQSLSACGNIQFTNQSTGQASLTYSWNFGDLGSGSGNTSSVLNPVHQFSACGSFKVCLKITAANGCMDSICQTVTYQDQVKPIITCPKDLILPCNSSVNPANTGFATATDNCMTTSAIGISFSDLLSGSLSCNATFTRTWVTTDACKNASSCVQIIKIKDTVPPIINCPQNIGVQCTADTNPLNTGTATATDDCTIPSSIIIWGSDVLTGQLPCNATIVRTFSAEDACGNKSKCIQVITVKDNTPPSIRCPKDTSLQCPANTAPSSTGTATATDNCTPTALIVINATELLSGKLPCNGTITRTWKATDECGNSATCKQIIKVKDTIAPTISCPPNSTVNTNPGVCYFTGIYPSASAKDTCDPGPTITCSLLTPASSILITPATQYPKGINTITCYAIDACGNQSKNCAFTLSVEDHEKPKITCPSGMSVLGTFDSLGRCKAIVKNIAPVVSDNCPMLNVSYTLTGATIGQGVTDASGTNFMSGTTSVHYTVTDMAGNKDTCSFDIKVICESNWSCPCNNGTTGSQNLVTNGNFSGGNTGFTNDFTYFAPGGPTTIGKYSVLTNTQVPLANSQWACSDHTTGIGSFLICDGASSTGPVAWRQTIPGSDSGSFNLCFYANNLVIPSKNYDDPVLGVFINGVQVGPAITLPENPDAWVPVTVSWLGSLPAIIEIQTLSTQSIGNDFALDDIRFTQCSTINKDSCRCGSFPYLALLHPGAADQKINCGDTITLNCPFVFQLGGAFLCKGNCGPFTTNTVNWNITGPVSTSGSVIAHPDFILPVNSSNFSINGFYTLTLNGHCLGKECPPCKIYFEVKGCSSCCKDSISFANSVANFQLNDSASRCTLFFNGKGLDSCMQVTWIWGDGATTGPVQNATAVSHTYSGTGAHNVCYLIEEVDASGKICWNYERCDKRYLNCDTTWPCACPNGIVSTNLILNGNFSGGNTSFTSDFNYFAPGGSTNIGDYSVVTSSDVPVANAQWACTDHTSGTGWFLICDGTDSAGAVAWRQTINGPGAGTFNLCFYANNLVLPSKNFMDPDLGVFINGVQIIPTITLPETPDVWVPITVSWTGTLPATIEIKTMSFQVVGNDFALDDIAFTQCTSIQTDHCCKDSISFANAVANFQLNDSASGCTLFFNGKALDSCMQVTYIWGDGDTTGPVHNATAVSHAYVGTGSHNVCYVIENIDNNGKVCNSYMYCDRRYLSCDTCCKNYDHFCQNVMNAVSISVNHTNCKVTLSVGNLPDCSDYIESINWGDSHNDYGPYSSGATPMHIYSNNGSYIISYLAIELNPLTGLICFEKIIKDTIRVECGPCPNNLVPNPSFELYDSCPTGLAGPFTVSTWTIPTTGGSADYYNSCASTGSGVDVPANTFGTQTPHTGSAYAGFILRPSNTYREYLEVPLQSPLIKGCTYQVSFFVSLSDESRWAIDKFGAYLSVGAVGPIPLAPVLPLVPQVANPFGNYITNKTTWTLVSGTYLANGGEDHLVVGNFYDNVATTIITGLGGFYPGSYYYIDDVSVCSGCTTPTIDSCCADSLTFATLVNQGFTITQNKCKVTVTAPQFDSCYYFGTPPVLDGAVVSQVITYPSGNSWMYTFNQSGVHQICVTVYDGCNRKEMCTRFEVKCDTCYCGSFSNLSARLTGGAQNQPIQCGKTYTLKCPTVFQFSGDFKCQGIGCDSTYVEWNINGPIGGGGTVLANTGFTLPLNAQSFNINGLYTLTLTGYCGGKPCPPCKIYFEVTGCHPCCKDSIAFTNAIANFQTNGALGNCIIFENGTGLDACMQVTWSWGDNTTNGPIGNATLVSHVYSGTNTYNVCYLIEEVDANGKICHSYKRCDSIYVICDSCECAGADHLSFGGGNGFTIPVKCGNTKSIEIPCDPDGHPFYFHGNVNCKGDSCLGDQYYWVIKDSLGNNVINGIDALHIFNGNTGHFDILNLVPTLFIPGKDYTISVTWNCGGKRCTCDIKFHVKACDCKCGKFTNVFLRPTLGAPSIPVSCDGDAPIVLCPVVGQPFNVSGQFQCQGENCPNNTQVNWMLLDPMGNKVDSGIINSSPGWSINLNAHDFGKAGTYCLLLSGHCGSQICKCLIKFTFKEACPCDDCTCGKFSEMFIRSGQGPSQPVSCSMDSTSGNTRYIFNSCEACNKECPGVCFLEAGGDLCKCYLDHTRTSNGVKIPCPPNGQDVVITGQVSCQGADCPKNTLIDWILLDPNGLPIASMNNVIANPNFTVHISPLLLTQTNDYTLQLISHCGSQQCTCQIKFQMEAPCPDKCECDKFSILSSISRGPITAKNCGDTIYVPDGLKLFFSAAFNCKGVCPPYTPIVSWSLIGPPGFRPYGGNASATPNLNLGIDETTFNLPGIYTLTMIGHCGNKECICKITFITPAKCCQDKEIFSQSVMNAITVSVDNTKCKVTVNINKLSNCDYIEKISWGNGKESAGPFSNGDMPMNTYTSNGIYIISYIAIETDPATGEYCFVKLFKDTVRIDCGTIGNLIQTQNQSFGERVRVFPNPTTGKFIVDLPKPAASGTILRVVGLTGQVLMEKFADPGVKEQIVIANTLPQGMYFIQVFVNGKPTAVEKFVKQ